MTKRILRQASIAGAVAAGAALLAGGVAHAGGDIVTTGNNGIANGNQVVAPIQAPINVCGNAVGALVGIAGAGCDGGSDANLESGSLADMVSAGNNGIANGNQVQAPIQAPINVCGNAVGALIGVAGAGCDGGSSADIRHGHSAESAKVTEASKTPQMVTAGNKGVLGGTQVAAPIQAPINVCGNAVAVAGAAGAGCDGGTKADLGHHAVPDMTSVDNSGIANGTQIFAPIQLPIDISGNAVGVLGIAGAGSDGGSTTDIGPSR